MKFIKYFMLIKFYFIFSIFTNAEPFCILQPKDYDEKSIESIHSFEENIENKISSIYQTEYPYLKNKIEEIRELKKKLQRLEKILFNKYIRQPNRGHKYQHMNNVIRDKRKIRFHHFLDENIQLEEEFNSALKGLFARKSFSFTSYREAVAKRTDLQHLIDTINNEIEPMQQPHFLYPPKLNFSIRDNDIYYGDIQMEVFFTPPKDNLLKIPFLNIGFETNKNTIIYTCIHLDAYDESRNAIYIYFLTATKFNVVSLKDIVTSFDLIIRNILTFYREPEVIVSPVPIIEDPAGSIITPITKVMNTLSVLQPLKVINSVISKMQVFTLASRLNPTVQVIMDNVDVGIKGIYIHPKGLKVRYAASTLYGLFNLDLITQNQQKDFSEFMNVLTITEQDDSDSMQNSMESEKDATKE